MRNTDQIDTMRDAIKDGSTAIVKKLLDEGFAIDQSLSYAEHWDSALFWAVTQKQPAVVQLLLERGADVAQTNAKGETVLHYAIVLEVPEIARMLIAAGAPVNAFCHVSLTPLHYASTVGECEMLLGAGADPSIEPSEEALRQKPAYRTPFQTAFSGGRDAVSLLMFVRGKENPYQTTLNGKTLDELCEKNPPMREILLAMRTEWDVRAALLPEVDTIAPNQRMKTPHL